LVFKKDGGSKKKTKGIESLKNEEKMVKKMMKK
jgi:hypothetical protein